MDIGLADEFYMVMSDIEKIACTAGKTGILSKSEFGMLSLIKFCSGDCDSVTTSMLSKHLEVSKSAVSQLLSNLEEKGYIHRSTNENDRRHIHICITDAGEKKLEIQKGEISKKVKGMLESLGTEDSREFIRLLRKVVCIFSELE